LTINRIDSTFAGFGLTVFQLCWSMNSGHLLREITAGSDEVSWILLVDNDLCREEFGVLAANQFEQFFDFLSIGEALIRVFM
jgi:hypothetical protein